ncbi:uncharacterized protein [Nicotiana sylvestris]|uniref:uncharacterized protein n=1 Tax=Nicotiana sylvestris TaxID=4096 RepID=UPI00388CA21E
MAKMSKIVPQKEKASSSRPASDKISVEPRLEEPWKRRCHEAPSREDEVLPPASKPVKDKKRKRISTSETPKSKKIKAHKSKKDTAVLPADIVQRLRDEKEENEDASFELVTFEPENVKADAEAIVAVYRDDAEATQARAKKVADTTQTRSYWAAEHDKYQYRRETLEEIHARGFNFAVEIENAKELEAEDKTLLSFDDDDSGSVSGSESGGDSDCKGVAPEEN